jgi:hypothetical protein
MLVYSMNLVADGEFAMALPIPVRRSSPENAVRFDMSSSPTFVDQLDLLFPEEVSRGYGALRGEALPFAPQPLLAVRDVVYVEAFPD